MPSLGHDLAAIRKKKGISLDDIHQSTKIPKKVLKSIEDNSIFRNKGGSDIYIRGYVRSYAKALAIEERDIVYALNKVEKNNYTGSLIDDDDRSDKEETNHQTEKEPTADDEETEPHPLDVDPDDMPAESDNPLSKSDDVHSIDWADMGYQFQPSKTIQSNKNYIVPLALLILAVIAFSAYWFYFRNAPVQSDQNSRTASPTQTTTPSDSLQLGLMPSTGGDSANFKAQQSGNDALPDTLSMVLYAAYDKLEPVRVYTDIADELNPYWIDQGEAIEFNFVNSFQFRDGLNNIILLMNGHRISNFKEQFFNPQSGRVEINRSFFKKDSKWLQPQPDTLALDVPPPSVIHQSKSQN